MEGLQGAQAEAQAQAEIEAETKPASTPPTKLSRLGALPTDALRLALSFLDVRGLARLDSAWTCAREREHHWLAALRAAAARCGSIKWRPSRRLRRESWAVSRAWSERWPGCR